MGEELGGTTDKPYVMGPDAVDLTEAQDGGVMKEVLRAGKAGEQPLKGDTVIVHYVGTLQSNGVKFDSSRDRNEKFEFSLGKGSVIKAWDIGVATMCKGELAVLVCKSEYAYGAEGSSPSIPPNATLVFEVELFDWRGEDVSEEKDGSILKSILREGEGYRSPHEMSSCKIHIVGRVEGREFQDDVVSFVMGEVFDGSLVPGVEQALQQMKKGEHARVKIQSKHAYGAKGDDKLNIPPNTDIEFDIELLEFDEPKDSWKLDNPEKIVESTQAKERGTELFKSGHYAAAQRYYKHIVELIAAEDTMEGDMEAERVRLLLAARLNDAMCSIKLSEFTDAIESCTSALTLDDKNEKALYRRGLSYLSMREYELAVDDFRATLKVEPNNGPARKNLAAALEAIKKRKELEKSTYRGMFEKFAKQDEKHEKELVTSEPTEGAKVDSSEQVGSLQNEKGDANTLPNDDLVKSDVTNSEEINVA